MFENAKVFIMAKKEKFLDKPIDCPRCWVRTDRVNRKGVEIDICPKCNGIWLDTRELKKLIDSPRLYDYLTSYMGTEAQSKLVCPRCGGLMNLEEAEEIEVDVCLSCRGVWLDAHELEALKEAHKSYKSESEEKELESRKDELDKKKGRREKIVDRLREFFYYS
jgi:Zn-finger nucleic acid-binding protein